MGKRKRYGVKGMMEWQAVVPVGKAKFTFHFAGGMLTAYGVTPATYETDNALFQQVIENSDYFRNGKIEDLKVYETEGGAVPAGVAVEAAGVAVDDAAVAGGSLEEIRMATVKDARQFLIDGYGADASKLLRREDVVRYGRSKGVDFVFEK